MKTIFESVEKAFIYIVLYCLIGVISYILITTFIHSLSTQISADLNVYAISEAAKKSTVLILISFLVVLLGCVIVLKGIETSYKLTVETDKIKSNLETASPGLVMITLGCALLAFGISKNFSVTTTPSITEDAVVVADTASRQNQTASSPKLAKLANAKLVKTNNKQHSPPQLAAATTENNNARYAGQPKKNNRTGQSVSITTTIGPTPSLYLTDTVLMKTPEDRAKLQWALKFQERKTNGTYKPTNQEQKKFDDFAWEVSMLRNN